MFTKGPAWLLRRSAIDPHYFEPCLSLAQVHSYHTGVVAWGLDRGQKVFCIIQRRGKVSPDGVRQLRHAAAAVLAGPSHLVFARRLAGVASSTQILEREFA